MQDSRLYNLAAYALLVHCKDVLRDVVRQNQQASKRKSELFDGCSVSASNRGCAISTAAVDVLHSAAEATYFHLRVLSFFPWFLCVGTRHPKEFTYVVFWGLEVLVLAVKLAQQAYLSEQFVRAGMIAAHNGRTTTSAEDMVLARRLQEVTSGQAIIQPGDNQVLKRRRRKSAP